MNEKMRRLFQRGAVLSTAAYLSIPTAFAQQNGGGMGAIDVASVVSDIKAQMSSITLVGGAILAIFVGIKAFKWVRGALS